MRQLRKLGDLTGYSLNAGDGEIGRLEEIYFDDKRWVVRYLVARTGNWLLGRKVLIVPQMILRVDEDTKTLNADVSLEQVKSSPPIDSEQTVTKHYEREYHVHYDWEPYWILDPIFGGPAYVPRLERGEPDAPRHPHLHSSNELNHYAIHANDGAIGHVADLVIEEPGWQVRYLEVDTRNWLPGKHVLVSPAWVQQVDWSKREVVVDLSRAAIESAPAYDRGSIISRDYELALFQHYGRNLED